MIKAIAAYTKRHLVEIPLSRIRTCDELKRAFFLNSYDKLDLNFDKKIIVFEDIDCSKWNWLYNFDKNILLEIVSHIVRKRSTIASRSEPMTTMEGDDFIVQLEQTDIDARKKRIPKQSLRTLLGNWKNTDSIIIIHWLYLDCR